MQVDQALYGERSGGHSLLAASEGGTLAKDVVQRLDLPDTAPPGVDWSPFLRGFPYENWYVLARTFQDAGASRGGMVFSHALFVSLEEIAEARDLRPIVSLLATSAWQRPEAKTVEVVGGDGTVREAGDLVEAAEALSGSGRLPVVRLGHPGFEELVVALWARLLPKVRRDFPFRLSFDPRDLLESPRPSLICTPRGMAGRWTDYAVMGRSADREASSLAGAVLSGRARGEPLVEFMRDVGVSPGSILELRLAERAYHFATEEPVTLEGTVAAARLVGKLTGGAGVGKKGKEAIVGRLCAALTGAEAGDMLRLRNLEMCGFQAGERVWVAVAGWVAANGYPEEQDAGMLSVLRDAQAAGAAVEEWRGAVLSGFAVSARKATTGFVRAFWRWLRIEPGVVAGLFGHVPVEGAIEEALAGARPGSVSEASVAALRSVAVARGWLRLYGAALAGSCSPLDAARRQMRVDRDPGFVAGLRWALSGASRAELVACALEIEDERLARLAGEAVAEEPGLLGELGIPGTRAQVVWREALEVDQESWHGVGNGESGWHSVLDRLLDEGEADFGLMEQLSETPLGDLGTYSRREEVWSRVEGVARRRPLAATAKGWLCETSRGGVPFVPERELQGAIMEQEGLAGLLIDLMRGRVGIGVRVVGVLDGYRESEFLDLLGRRLADRTAVIGSDAESIGGLVLTRRWRVVAAELVGRYRAGRLDLRPALRVCHNMLGLWDRFGLGLLPISEGERWRAFEEVAVQLYPGGSDDQELWTRAGGDDGELVGREDGRTRWRKAIRGMRRGRGPRAGRVLAAMMEDFPNNQRVAHLAGDGGLSETVGGSGQLRGVD